MACKCFGTHTGGIDECVSYYSAVETSDNVTDEVAVGYVSCTEAESYVDGSAMACDNGCGTFADLYFKPLGKLVSEATSRMSYVGGKPIEGVH